MQIPFIDSGKFYYFGKEYACALYYSEDGGGIFVKIIKHTKSGIGDYGNFHLKLK